MEAAPAAGSGWGLAVAWSPLGAALAWSGRGGGAAVLDAPAACAGAEVWAAARRQDVELPGALPLRALAFLNEECLAAGGFDSRPLLLRHGAGGWWASDGFQEAQAADADVVTLAPLPGGRFLSASSDGRVVEWCADGAAAS
jgi:hypothetical protein